MRKGWEKKKLNEFCEFSNGLWTGKKPPFQTVGVIRNTNFTKDCLLDDSDVVYLEVEQSQFQKRKLEFGDIILEKSGGGPKQPVGRVVIFNKVEGHFSFSNFTSVIRVKDKNEVDYNYLHRFLFMEYISGATEKMQSHSTGIRNLKFDEYKTIEIPLPPLPEQQRIVAILDEAFAAIAKAKANAEQNLKNAKELFESYLQGVFENGKEFWEEKTLDKVCEFRNGAAHEQHINEDGKYILVNSKFISADGEKFKRTNNALAPLFVNDIAFVMSDVPNGKALAKCFLVDENDTYTLNQRIGAIKSKVFVPDFLVYQFNRNRYLLSFNNGENQTNLRKGDILRCPIWLPSIEDQQAIVRQLDALRAETQRLEAIYQQKLADLEELKKSILQKAFAGELTHKSITS